MGDDSKDGYPTREQVAEALEAHKRGGGALLSVIENNRLERERRLKRQSSPIASAQIAAQSPTQQLPAAEAQLREMRNRIEQVEIQNWQREQEKTRGFWAQFKKSYRNPGDTVALAMILFVLSLIVSAAFISFGSAIGFSAFVALGWATVHKVDKY